MNCDPFISMPIYINQRLQSARMMVFSRLPAVWDITERLQHCSKSSASYCQPQCSITVENCVHIYKSQNNCAFKVT